METAFTLSDIGIIVAILVAVCTGMSFVFKYAFFNPLKDDSIRHRDNFDSEKNATTQKRSDCDVKFTRLEKTPDLLSRINDSVLVIKLFLMSKHEDAVDALSVSHSPISLNEAGERLYTISGAKEILESNIEKYIKKIEALNLKTALDVEEQSLLILYGCSGDDEFTPLKNYVFNNPVFEKLSLNMASICFVMSIPLRDEFLKRNAGMMPVITQ
jgi:hypothetical protein